MNNKYFIKALTNRAAESSMLKSIMPICDNTEISQENIESDKNTYRYIIIVSR